MRVAVLLALFLSLPAWADDGTQKLFDCMRANIPPTLRIQDIELNAVDRAGGSRVLSGRLYAKRDGGLVRVMLRVAEPAQVAGAAYLVRESSGGEDDMYVFLPSVNRVRHVTGAFANGSLLGTDFTYAEAKLIQNAFTGASARLESPAKLDGRPVHVVMLQPEKVAEAPYSSVRLWVDQKTCVALRADFYAGDQPRKRLLVPPGAVKQSGKYWYPAEIEMRDLREATYTRLSVRGITSGSDLGARYFDPNAFYLGK